MNKLDGRRLFVWSGQNPTEDTNRLANAVAETAITELFNVNKNLVWLNEDQPVPVNKEVMREVITRHIVSIRLVNHGTADMPKMQAEYFSFDFPLGADTSKGPNQQVLLDLIVMLVDRVAKGPSEPIKLTQQQQQEVLARLKVGESKDRIAHERHRHRHDQGDRAIRV